MLHREDWESKGDTDAHRTVVLNLLDWEAFSQNSPENKEETDPYQVDVNLADANDHTAYQIGIMSVEPRVRKLVTTFKMRSKFPPLQRIDITVEELHKVHVSDAVNPKVFKSVAT